MTFTCMYCVVTRILISHLNPCRLLYNIDLDALSPDSAVKLKGDFNYRFDFGDENIAGTEFQEVEPDRLVTKAQQ